MALRRSISKRLFSFNHFKYDNKLPHVGIPEHSSPAIKSSLLDSTGVALKTLPEFSNTGLFRRFIQQKRGINQAAPTKLPEFLSIPVGDKLREKLKSLNVSGERVRFDGVLHQAPPVPELGGITITDAKKILRSAQLEKIRLVLKNIPANSIPYSDYLNICGEACDQNREQATEFAKKLDEAGSVIVVGNVVFLRPDQVATSIEQMISQTVAITNDPRRKELDEMEKQKAIIDQKAEALVKGELYCGLGFLVLQTLGFMRLTFWELSWDVMEPICFFVTSLHFALAYGFFLRTSTEPSFEGFFRRRFKAKQRKLMKVHNFNVEKYEDLCRVFYPSYYENQAWPLKQMNKNNDHGRGAALSSV
ncbi:OLC1v1017881C1 [Oldenlandia corymbosa var. corymbosa]|uniref:OLC1v1017881C1 n=1 Tax=Oldenlandia corymbosa var. corymbosa TaxID=529605 RepID=A0AAV1EAD0_OLDCO|nr:OLC1v1017881C1 [Oldenlandia corymbosa var. corymbosa]